MLNNAESLSFFLTHHRFSVTFFFSLAFAFCYSAENKLTCKERKSVTLKSMRKDKLYTQDVSFSQNTEEKIRGKGLKTVWDDENE